MSDYDMKWQGNGATKQSCSGWVTNILQAIHPRSLCMVPVICMFDKWKFVGNLTVLAGMLSFPPAFACSGMPRTTCLFKFWCRVLCTHFQSNFPFLVWVSQERVRNLLEMKAHVPGKQGQTNGSSFLNCIVAWNTFGGQILPFLNHCLNVCTSFEIVEDNEVSHIRDSSLCFAVWCLSIFKLHTSRKMTTSNGVWQQPCRLVWCGLLSAVFIRRLAYTLTQRRFPYRAPIASFGASEGQREPATLSAQAEWPFLNLGLTQTLRGWNRFRCARACVCVGGGVCMWNNTQLIRYVCLHSFIPDERGWRLYGQKCDKANLPFTTNCLFFRKTCLKCQSDIAFVWMLLSQTQKLKPFKVTSCFVCKTIQYTSHHKDKVFFLLCDLVGGSHKYAELKWRESKRACWMRILTREKMWDLLLDSQKGEWPTARVCLICNSKKE